MHPIFNPQSSAPFSQGAFIGSKSFQAEQTRAGSVSLAQSTDLTITTDEGDTVSLSLASALDVNAGTYRGIAYQDGQRTASQATFLELSQSRTMAVEVDGNLNAAEWEDIQEAVNAIGAMIDDFLSGDLQEMAKDGESLKELDSIDSLEAAFSYERKVLYGQQEQVTISTTASAESHRPHGHGRFQRLIQRIDRLADDMAGQVKEFPGSQKQLAGAIDALFTRYRKGDRQSAPPDEFGQAVVQTLQTTYTQKVDTRDESMGFNFTYAA